MRVTCKGCPKPTTSTCSFQSKSAKIRSSDYAAQDKHTTVPGEIIWVQLHPAHKDSSEQIWIMEVLVHSSRHSHSMGSWIINNTKPFCLRMARMTKQNIGSTTHQTFLQCALNCVKKRLADIAMLVFEHANQSGYL